MGKRKFINKNKVYRVDNRYLGIQEPGFHHVIVVWKHGGKQIARVKTITSLEHERTLKNGDVILKYDKEALKEAKYGKITPYSIKELGTKHWSAISNSSKVINVKRLRNTKLKIKKPKRAK